MGDDFIGSGWAFPVQADPFGRIALVSGGQEIEESIRIILGTARGDRPMRPEFGCGIHDYVFAPVNDETIGSIARDAHQSLARWEPRIDVHQVDVRTDRDHPGLMLIEISYAVRRTNDPRNLVVPFYVLPTEPAAVTQPVEGAA